MYWPRRSCIQNRRGHVLYFGTELKKKPEPNIDSLSFAMEPKARISSARCFRGGLLLFGMRRSDDSDQQLQKYWRERGPVHYRRTRQRGCHSWANGNFLCSSDGRSAAQLPVGEEWSRYQRRDFFDVHDSTYDSFRRSCAIRGSR